MSAPTKPFAKGYGVLLGVIVLWAGTIALFCLGRALLLALFPGEGAV